jgi:hypothetical protein
MNNKFHLNQKIVLCENLLIKKISEIEEINNEIIYYMSDNTSYSESQILLDQENFIKCENLISNLSKERLFQIVRLERAIENGVEWYKHQNKKRLDKILSKQTDPSPSRKRPLLSSLFDFLRRGF